MLKNSRAKLHLIFFCVVSILICADARFAQSNDPDRPTPLSDGAIAGTSSGGLNDPKTYYHTFDVSKGTLTLTLDIVPLNNRMPAG